jgi:hypothetical protein
MQNNQLNYKDEDRLHIPNHPFQKTSRFGSQLRLLLSETLVESHEIFRLQQIILNILLENPR